MKRNLLLAAAVAAFATAGAHAADVSGDAGAKIIQPLAVAAGDDLYFGTIVPSTTAGDTVAVNAAGAKTCGAELTCLTDDHTAASFNVTGEADYTYSITLPSSITITNANGTDMTVGSVVGSKSTGTLTSGADSFTVGGTLAVAQNQEAGTYNGTFVVAVEYQ